MQIRRLRWMQDHRSEPRVIRHNPAGGVFGGLVEEDGDGFTVRQAEPGQMRLWIRLRSVGFFSGTFEPWEQNRSYISGGR